MKHLLIFIILSAFSICSANDQTNEAVDLIPPIATEREDGLDKLPSQVFTDSTGVETWFVEERGFKAANIADKKPAEKLSRTPAAKKVAPSANKKMQNPKRKPASQKQMSIKKKTGSKK
jgi:hypothetical protein